jgi:hypothetical protein
MVRRSNRNEREKAGFPPGGNIGNLDGDQKRALAYGYRIKKKRTAS